MTREGEASGPQTGLVCTRQPPTFSTTEEWLSTAREDSPPSIRKWR